MAAKKERVDVLLVRQGLVESQEMAKRLVMAGEVLCGTERVDKASQKVPVEAELKVKSRSRYVGRGGFKMEGALKGFGIDPTGFVCADLGSSTGGFTDCLLQHGAVRVHCVDVGTNQLAYKIRMDKRVTVREQFNARQVSVEELGEAVDLVVMDLSFVSLTKILPAAFSILREGGRVVALIKPQFELPKEEIGAGGIVRDQSAHERAVAKIREFVEESGRDFVGVIDSPITGTDGNREFLGLLR